MKNRINIETWFNTKDIKRYYFPGKIIEGKGSFEKAFEFLTDNNFAIIIIDSYFKNDKKIKKIFYQKNLLVKFIDGAPISQDIIDFYKKIPQTPDIVFCLGGGSVSDFGKALLAKITFGEFDSIGLHGKVPLEKSKKPLFISVPTTAASGAESSRYFVTYDKNDHHKVFGKNWNLVADWIFLDPYFLKSVSNQSLVSGAFDIFVHLFETLICKNESSITGEMISLECIPETMLAIHKAILNEERSDEVHSILLHCATFGGIAISNVRTGNIHEAAGALLEISDLNHPETLFVFFRSVIEQYSKSIKTKEKKLIDRFNMYEDLKNINSLFDLVFWWEQMFTRVNLDIKIKSLVSSIKLNPSEIKKHLFDRVWADKVWNLKEGPINSDEKSIMNIIIKSLAKYRSDFLN